MRFSTRTPAPNYLGRHEQRRLFMAIGLLALILFLMREAGKPANWQWFVLLSGPPTAIPAGPGIDTRLPPPGEDPTVPGAVTVPANPQPAAATAEGYFAGVQANLLSSVRDDTVFRGAEHDAFFHLFEILHDTDAATLDAASSGQTAFAQMYQQPAEYRGKLVSLRGVVRGVFEVPASRNDYGITKYYQVWIQPHDNPGLPVVAYVLNLPPEFPIAERMHEEVELTGFFFKRWAYRAQDAIRSAPLVLAKTLRWEQPAVATTAPMNLALVLGTITCALLVAGMMVWMAARGGGYAGPTPPVRRTMRDASGESPAEALRRLAEQSEQPASVAAAPVGTASDPGSEPT